MERQGIAWHSAIVSPSRIFIWRKGWRNNALPSGERPVLLYYVLKKLQEANRVVLAELLYGSFVEETKEETCIVDSSIHIVNSRPLFSVCRIIEKNLKKYTY